MKKFGFDFSHIKGDLFGGITAGIVALPLALAFGLQSGMGATAGLYGAIFISFFAALFGGTSTQISGPTAPMTAVSMVVVAGIVAANEGDLGLALPAILFVFLLAGLIQIVLGVIRIGQYIRYIPYPVVSGFMTGIGVIILITQILPMLGYYGENDADLITSYEGKAKEILLADNLKKQIGEETAVIEDYTNTVNYGNNISDEVIREKAKKLAVGSTKGVMGSLKALGRAVSGMNHVDLILGLVTIFIIYGFKRITKVIPSSLVALVAVTLGAYLILGSDGYRNIGNIPSGFPKLQLGIFSSFNLSAIMPYIFTAVGLALLGVIDSLLTSIVADNLTKTKHKPNQELIGQGIGNSVAALFGGLPGAGATIRTVVNIDAGGRTKLSGMIAAVILLVVLLALGPLASLIPSAVLAGILVTVGIGVMDYKGLKHLPQLPLGEVAVMLIVLVLTVFVGLIEAVGVGMVLAAILFMKKISDVVEDKTHASPLKEFSHEISWSDEGDIIDKMGDRVYIKHLDGPLFFGFASRFQDMMKQLPKMEVVIIRMDKVPYMDQSGLYAMENAVQDLQKENIKVVLVDAHGQPRDMMEDFELIPGLIPTEDCFKDFEACTTWLREYLKEEHRFEKED